MNRFAVQDHTFQDRALAIARDRLQAERERSSELLARGHSLELKLANALALAEMHLEEKIIVRNDLDVLLRFAMAAPGETEADPQLLAHVREIIVRHRPRLEGHLHA